MSNEKTGKENEQVTFEITEHIGVLNAYSSGWRKELNMVSWNGREPKYDIRDWDPDHEKMSRGVTFTKGEAGRLLSCLEGRNLEHRELYQNPERRDKELER